MTHTRQRKKPCVGALCQGLGVPVGEEGVASPWTTSAGAVTRESTRGAGSPSPMTQWFVEAASMSVVRSKIRPASSRRRSSSKPTGPVNGRCSSTMWSITAARSVHTGAAAVRLKWSRSPSDIGGRSVPTGRRGWWR